MNRERKANNGRSCTRTSAAGAAHEAHGGATVMNFIVKTLSVVVAFILVMFAFGLYQSGVWCKGPCLEQWRAEMASRGREDSEPPPSNGGGRWSSVTDGPVNADFRHFNGNGNQHRGYSMRRPPAYGGMMGGRGQGQLVDSNVCRPCPEGFFRRPIPEGPHGECNCSR